MSWGYVAVASAAVVGGALSAESSRKAARSQKESAKSAIQEQEQARVAAEEALDPFARQGLAALKQQSRLAGLEGTRAQQAAFETFADTPGQQFLRDQQERALLRNASAIGGLGGGNVRTALQEQAFARAQTDIDRQFNRLASIAGRSQVAAQNIGQLGMQSAANVGQLQQAAGAARASGILGQTQAVTGTISDLTGLAAQSGLLSQQQQPQVQPVQQAVAQTQPTGFSISGGAGLRPIGQ